MSTRFRENDGEFEVCGMYHNYPVNLHVSHCLTHGPYENCFDTVGDWETVNGFSLYRSFMHYPVLGGQELAADGSVLREYVGYPIAYRPGPPDPHTQFGAYSSLDLSNKAWEILGRTNPNVPHVSVPQALGELKDIPELVKGWGVNLLQKVAKGYLSWRWALRPMIGDLRKLLKFVKAVDERTIHLLRLRDGQTLRRRCHLGEANLRSNPSYVIFHSEGSILKGWRCVIYSYKEWGTAQWKLDPASNLPSLGYGPLKDIARRLSLGITSHEALSVAWELTPWSWLVDWFTDVGDVIAATNNSVALTWDKVCLMRTSDGKSEYTLDKNASDSWPTFSGWYEETCTRKERHPVFPVTPIPIPYLPILDGGKLSILASLAALRS